MNRERRSFGEDVSAHRLTERQEEVLELAARGLCNKEIGALLDIQVTTVKFHVSRLLQEFGVANRTALVRAWTERGHVRRVLRT